MHSIINIFVNNRFQWLYGDIIYPDFSCPEIDKLLVIILTGLYHAGR